MTQRIITLLFVVLAASMLGLFTIEMPGFIQERLSSTSNKQQGGTYIGVGVMGALSALIVSACVAPPLIAALTVISQTGDVVRGGLALFVMSIGMGTPLLLVGASAGKLLPKAGAWMDTVKNLFGVLFLGVAAWMLARIVPGWLSMIFWAVPALVLAWVLWRARAKSSGGRAFARALATAASIYGVALISGLTDVDAITLSSAELFKSGRLNADTAWRAFSVSSFVRKVHTLSADATLRGSGFHSWLLRQE